MKRKLFLSLFLIFLSGMVVVSLSALIPVNKFYPPPGTSILKPFVFEWDYPDPTGVQPDGYLFGLWFETDGTQGMPPDPFDPDGNPLPEYWINVGTNTTLNHDDPLITGYIAQFWPWWPWCTPCHWWWWEVWPYIYVDDVIQYLDVTLYNPWIFHDSYPAIDKLYPPHGIDIIKPFIFQWQSYPDLVFDPPAGYDFGGYLLGIWWDPWYCQGEPPWPFPIPWDPLEPLPEPYPQPPYPDPPSDWPGMLWVNVGDVTSISSNDDLITSYMAYWIGDPFWWPWCIPCYYWWWEVWPYYYYVDTAGGVIEYWYPDPYYYCFWPWKFHADGPPLPVELSSFTASVVFNNFVQLTWVSETESNMLGYNVFRNTEDFIDEAVRINPLIIPASNTSQQQVYTYVDQEITSNVTYYYWLEMSDLDLTSRFYGPITILIDENDESSPSILYETELVGAFPNPFNPDTNIAFTLAEDAKVTISIYNVKGQKVQTLTDNGTYDKGYHTVNWDGKDSNGRLASSGVYYYRMETNTCYVMIKKMLLMK